MTPQEKWQDYLQMLKKPFHKRCRLRFLNPDGTTAFSVDNNEKNRLSSAFISDGTLTVNLQNGARRTVSGITFDGNFEQFQYNVNNLWFGTEIALDEGLVLSDGSDYYIQQGVFLVETPTEIIAPDSRLIQYDLIDKWAYLDGTLGGNLECTHEIPVGTNIFQPISALLVEDRGNGLPIDRVTPVYTEYYNGMTQELPDGSTAYLTDTPYTLRIDGDSGTIGAVIDGLAAMLNAWYGYDPTGALRFDPSQDDILDSTKPILYDFSMDDVTLLGLTYTSNPAEVYNDYIVVGEQLDNYAQPKGRAQNYAPESPTNINLIGRKTVRETKSGYGTDTMCQDYAVWMLKRSAVLQQSITISCSQMFHLVENTLVSIKRTDKKGSPVERHLVHGFSRPISHEGAMTINAVSVHDFPSATIS